MNDSPIGAGATAHLRILLLGALAAAVVVMIGLTARVNAEDVRRAEPRIESPSSEQNAPPAPPPRGKVVVV